MGERGKKAMSDEVFDIVEGLDNYAKERGRDLLTLAISWLASKPYVSSVISGATSAEQVKANATAADWQLSEDEMAAVNQLSAR